MKKCNNVFVSIPMNGRDLDDIKKQQQQIVSEYKKLHPDESYELLHSCFEVVGFEHTRNIPVYYLSRSLQQLSFADLVIFGPGWENARGCRIEHQIAVDYNIPFIEL